MSRSGYSDDCEDQWGLIRWRGAVNSAIKGKRGQAFLREALSALDAMPEKTLTTNELEADGEFCTLGVVGHARGLALDRLDTYDRESVAAAFGISAALAAEIMYENDEAVCDWRSVTVQIVGPMRPRHPDWGRHDRHYTEADPTAGARRWASMRKWVADNLITAASRTTPKDGA